MDDPCGTDSSQSPAPSVADTYTTNELAQRTAKVLTTGVLDAAVFNEESVEESTVALRVPSQVVVSRLPAHLS